MIYIRLRKEVGFFSSEMLVQYFPADTLVVAREIDEGGSAYGLFIVAHEDWSCSWLPPTHFSRVSPLELLAMEAS